MAEERATDVLREEHQSINRVVASMAVLLAKLEAGEEVKPETLQPVIEFMRLGGAVHEKKEESVLFPMLEAKGISAGGATIERLVMNHQEARVLISRLGTATEINAAGWLPMEAPLIEALRGLANLYPMHLWQEDMLLYRVTDRSLSPEEDQELRDAFRRLDDTAGGDVRGRMRQLADEVESKAW